MNDKKQSRKLYALDIKPLHMVIFLLFFLEREKNLRVNSSILSI